MTKKYNKKLEQEWEKSFKRQQKHKKEYNELLLKYGDSEKLETLIAREYKHLKVPFLEESIKRNYCNLFFAIVDKIQPKNNNNKSIVFNWDWQKINCSCYRLDINRQLGLFLNTDRFDVYHVEQTPLEGDIKRLVFNEPFTKEELEDIADLGSYLEELSYFLKTGKLKDEEFNVIYF